MLNKNLLTITLIVFGVMLGSVFGFWSTMGMIASLLILISAKKYWREKTEEPVAQPA